MKKVSVIIPTYNGADFIGETIDSALAQTYPELEIIVVDDGSTDSMEEIVKSHAAVGRIKYIRRENGGVARARNIGIAASTGNYIALLDHDDLWMPGKIEKQVKFLNETGAEIVFCNGVTIPAGNPVLGKGIFRAGVEDVLDTILMKGYNLMPSALLFDREVLKITGGLEESIPGADDWDLSISMARNYKIGFIDEPLYGKRAHGDNFTGPVLGKVDYFTVIYEKQRPFFARRERMLREAMSNKCFSNARKNMSMQRLDAGLKSWAYSVRFKKSTLLKLPALLVRYVRFKLRKVQGGTN